VRCREHKVDSVPAQTRAAGTALDTAWGSFRIGFGKGRNDIVADMARAVARR
jgi:hypothetical protein